MTAQHDKQLEARIQAAAEGVGIPSDLPAAEVEAYRRMYRAIRQTPLPALAPDFACRLEQLTRDLPEQAAVEIWILRGLGALLLVAMASLAPALLQVVAAAAAKATLLPWPLLLGSCAALFFAGAVDRIALVRR